MFDPFEICGEFINESSTKEEVESVVDTICYDVLLPRSMAMVALLTGKTADSGVITEIVTMALKRGPVIGIMPDGPLVGERGNSINIMPRRYMNETHGGALFVGDNAMSKGLEHLKRLQEELLRKN